ncbi:hypothetical protein UFOVP998_52 [uncultured Caudovirales phage]|uniref:Uncharacterized protein n=1 Tax=uncultured Caudovirales phage TaxID=2100421 RepID=A0A6J7XB28_9CAUD|nr:hypothetical protein UFOVP998_52 [uncultured Caudovirales phage]CAB4198946.1 hypothetical protein UFOVP1331_7 [uncultured Caudovirales phage]CAB4212488.1 hypothetical protein UFOVP1442_6 [uncultured Caudovirales phage]CAB5228086.1 hypothetical protein UFOVP1535_45 [uncultured Caudovirales phage]
MKAPLTFTMALWAKVDAANGDRYVTDRAVLTRLMPYDRAGLSLHLPPTFFRAVQRIGEAQDRDARFAEELAR